MSLKSLLEKQEKIDFKGYNDNVPTYILERQQKEFDKLFRQKMIKIANELHLK